MATVGGSMSAKPFYRIAVLPGDIRSLAAGKMGKSATEVGDLVAAYIVTS